MLTKEHAIAEYDFQRQRILPDRLTSVPHAHYLSFAEKMLDVYRMGTGRRRGDLHRDIHRDFVDEVDCPLRRIEAFCKLLDDQSQYADAGRRAAPKLRQQVFRIAARHHPLVSQADRLFDNAVEDVRELIAKDLQRDWIDIRSELFADIIENHQLESFDGYPNPSALLSRYNVAQVQATLFRAVSMVIDATTDFKRSLRAARLAKVLYSGQKTFIPDFVFRHNDGRVVLMEIIGFWTPEYNAARLETLAVFREAPILLAIHESTSHHFELSPGTARSVTYKSALLVKPILQALATLFSGEAK